MSTPVRMYFWNVNSESSEFETSRSVFFRAEAGLLDSMTTFLQFGNTLFDMGNRMDEPTPALIEELGLAPVHPEGYKTYLESQQPEELKRIKEEFGLVYDHIPEESMKIFNQSLIERQSFPPLSGDPIPRYVDWLFGVVILIIILTIGTLTSPLYYLPESLDDDWNNLFNTIFRLANMLGLNCRESGSEGSFEICAVAKEGTAADFDAADPISDMWVKGFFLSCTLFFLAMAFLLAADQEEVMDHPDGLRTWSYYNYPPFEGGKDGFDVDLDSIMNWNFLSNDTTIDSNRPTVTIESAAVPNHTSPVVSNYSTNPTTASLLDPTIEFVAKYEITNPGNSKVTAPGYSAVSSASPPVLPSVKSTESNIPRRTSPIESIASSEFQASPVDYSGFRPIGHKEKASPPLDPQMRFPVHDRDGYPATASTAATKLPQRIAESPSTSTESPSDQYYYYDYDFSAFPKSMYKFAKELASNLGYPLGNGTSENDIPQDYELTYAAYDEGYPTGSSESEATTAGKTSENTEPVFHEPQTTYAAAYSPVKKESSTKTSKAEEESLTAYAAAYRPVNKKAEETSKHPKKTKDLEEPPTPYGSYYSRKKKPKTETKTEKPSTMPTPKAPEGKDGKKEMYPEYDEYEYDPRDEDYGPDDCNAKGECGPPMGLGNYERLGLGSYADVFSTLILGLVVLSGVGMFIPLIIGGHLYLGRSLDTSFDIRDIMEQLRYTEFFHAATRSFLNGHVCWDNFICAAGRGFKAKPQYQGLLRKIHQDNTMNLRSTADLLLQGSSEETECMSLPCYDQGRFERIPTLQNTGHI
ncbi:unnamed protein product [Cyprideis torosa]|uniref:Uncharacterized protein n=1 Tax=Cyprideis torosa TaxID=163714 RepID=A0A7R8W238_9CRUS|nr:unnamed protein product [Cyprideis torosa]CAG0879379.1 unnamed protein product [Cyprideis torosa]